MSKGRACPAWYACLALRGFFPMEEPATLRRYRSILQGHPVAAKTPGPDATGSLGMGVGAALEGKLTGGGYTVYVLLGDGELNEGVVWEAAAAAHKYALDNLVAAVDYNGLQLDGFTGEENRDFVVFGADIGKPAYFPLFGNKFPGRYFHLGVAELNTVGAAAGMALGWRTVAASSCGVFITNRALEADAPAGQGIGAEVIDLYSLKPSDREGLLASLRKTGALLAAENHQRRHGLGYELSNFRLKHLPVHFENLGLDDTFAESGRYPDVLSAYGQSAEHIRNAARELVAGKTDA